MVNVEPRTDKYGQPVRPVTVQDQYEPLGDEQITDLSESVGLADIPLNAGKVLLQAEGQNVRWRDSGNAPTSIIGTLLYVGQLFEYTGDLAAIRFIEAAAGAKLNVSYYR